MRPPLRFQCLVAEVTARLRIFICLVILGVGHTLLAGEKGKFTVTWLDLPVHGLAVVLETPSGKVFLVDTGGVRAKPEYNAGRDTVSPFLKARGHAEIEGIIISHPHGDHYGGAEWLLGNWKVNLFIDHAYEGRGQSETYTRLRALAVERGGAHRPVHAGDAIDMGDGLSAEVLSPPAEFLDPNSDPAKVSDHGLLNSNSVVLRVQHGKNVFLFPGDAYGGTYERYLKTLPSEKLKTTVLTAPHHGFNPGTDFPRMVMAKFVVASCIADYPSNANTPYPRSPGDHALRVFGSLGAQGFITAFNGNVTAVSDGETVTMTKERERPTLAAPVPKQ